MTYLLKFTTPLGIPVGVLKAGSSFSPSLMALIRNTYKGRGMGLREWGRVGAINSGSSPPPPWMNPGAAGPEQEAALRRALESGRLGCEPSSSSSW